MVMPWDLLLVQSWQKIYDTFRTKTHAETREPYETLIDTCFFLKRKKFIKQ